MKKGKKIKKNKKKFEAEQMQGQMLEIRQKVLGPEHPYTLMSLDNLAMALKRQGKHIDAPRGSVHANFTP